MYHYYYSEVFLIIQKDKYRKDIVPFFFSFFFFYFFCSCACSWKTKSTKWASLVGYAICLRDSFKKELHHQHKLVRRERECITYVWRQLWIVSHTRRASSSVCLKSLLLKQRYLDNGVCIFKVLQSGIHFRTTSCMLFPSPLSTLL